MAAIFETVKVTTGADAATAKTFYFRTKAGIYAGALATITGISKAPEAEFDNPTIPIGTLLQKGILSRVKARYTKTGKQRTGNLVCARHKIATVLDDLVDTSYNGSAIDSASFPVRRTFF